MLVGGVTFTPYSILLHHKKLLKAGQENKPPPPPTNSRIRWTIIRSTLHTVQTNSSRPFQLSKRKKNTKKAKKKGLFGWFVGGSGSRCSFVADLRLTYLACAHKIKIQKGAYTRGGEAAGQLRSSLTKQKTFSIQF
jgi:hypothetical protein